MEHRTAAGVIKEITYWKFYMIPLSFSVSFAYVLFAFVQIGGFTDAQNAWLFFILSTKGFFLILFPLMRIYVIKRTARAEREMKSSWK